MSEPLTDELLTQWEAYYVRISPTAVTTIRFKKMVAQIRELRENLDKHRQVRDEDIVVYPLATKTIKNLQDENARLLVALKDYGRHKNRCGWNHYESCDCGLDDVLAASTLKGES